MAEQQDGPRNFPAQHQDERPGHEQPMKPKPKTERPAYRGSGKLKDKVAIVTGGESGIGRDVAVYFAKEGANVAIAYLSEDEDAEETRRQVAEEGRLCLAVKGDIGDEAFCASLVRETMAQLDRIDVVVNNAAEQHPQERIEDISAEQLERTFRTNIFAMFHLVKAAMPHLKEGAAIINTASVTAYRGSPELLDYSATKGAIVAFTRSLALNLVKQGIRVNAVAPGPIWTPLIPSTFDEEKVASFGSQTPMQRAGQPAEVAPAYVYLASDDASYVTGQTLHINGGEVVGG